MAPPTVHLKPREDPDNKVNRCQSRKRHESIDEYVHVLSYLMNSYGTNDAIAEAAARICTLKHHRRKAAVNYIRRPRTKYKSRDAFYDQRIIQMFLGGLPLNVINSMHMNRAVKATLHYHLLAQCADTLMQFGWSRSSSSSKQTSSKKATRDGFSVCRQNQKHK